MLFRKKWYRFVDANKGFECLDFRYLPFDKEAFLVKDNTGKLYLFYNKNDHLRRLDLELGLFKDLNIKEVFDTTLFKIAHSFADYVIDIQRIEYEEKNISEATNTNDQIFYHVYNEKLANGTEKLKYNSKGQVISNLHQIRLHAKGMFINDFELRFNNFSKTKNVTIDGELKVHPKVNLFLKVVSRENAVQFVANIAKLEVAEVKSRFALGKPILSNINKEDAEKIKFVLEKSGVVCFLKHTFIELPKGSKVTLENGILHFISGDKNIPNFYISFVLHRPIGLATDYEFAGNGYFLPMASRLTVIDNQSFFAKYVQEFINYELSYENRATIL